jgi:PPP family 3-phenylpropionic acid transporter
MVLTIASVVAPPLFTLGATRYFGSRSILGVCGGMLPLLFLPMVAAPPFVWVVVVWFAVFLSLRGVATLLELAAVREAAAGQFRFERVRLWGSLGFIAAIAGGGMLVDRYGLGTIPWFAVALFVVVAVVANLLAPRVARVLPGSWGTSNLSTHHKLRSLVRHRVYIPLLLINFLNWGSHAVSGIYLSLYLESLGWSKTLISLAWGTAIAGEVGMFLLAKSLLDRVPLSALLLVNLYMSLLRWVLLATTASVSSILLANLLHAFSFAANYLCLLRMTHQVLDDEVRDTGQALLMGAGPGMGNLFGSLLAGVTASYLTSYREVRHLYWEPVAMTLVAIVVAHLVRGRMGQGEERASW